MGWRLLRGDNQAEWRHKAAALPNICGGLRERKQRVEHERWAEPEITEGIKSPDCVSDLETLATAAESSARASANPAPGWFW